MLGFLLKSWEKHEDFKYVGAKLETGEFENSSHRQDSSLLRHGKRARIPEHSDKVRSLRHDFAREKRAHKNNSYYGIVQSGTARKKDSTGLITDFSCRKMDGSFGRSCQREVARWTRTRQIIDERSINEDKLHAEKINVDTAVFLPPSLVVSRVSLLMQVIIYCRRTGISTWRSITLKLR